MKSMAGNFWLSSHCMQWLLDKHEVLAGRQEDLKLLTDEEIQKIHVFFANFIQALGELLKLRQQVIATATVYFKRFYARNSFGCVDPLLLAPTCVFLASKVEECGIISNTKFPSTCQQVVKKLGYAFKSDLPYIYRMGHILECEFYLMEMMDCCLIVYHPYRPLTQYVADIGQEETLLPLAWRIVNDTYRSDVCMLYPPYLIALAALHMACVVHQKDCKQWFAELSVDMGKVLEITQHMLQFYKMWKSYDEQKEIKGILARAPKPKTSSSRVASSKSRPENTSGKTTVPGYDGR
jgi:cyclin C